MATFYEYNVSNFTLKSCITVLVNLFRKNSEISMKTCPGRVVNGDVNAGNRRKDERLGNQLNVM